MGKFKVVYEDRDARWMRKIEGRRFHIIHLTDMVDACGSDAEEAYEIALKEVDIDVVPLKEMESALRSCGWKMDNGIVVQEHNGQIVADKDVDACLVQCLVDYGVSAPLFSKMGNDRGRLFREARKESYLLSSDRDAYEERMQRPVNRLGSTAREFGQGDLQSGLCRAAMGTDPAGKLAAKISGITPEKVQTIPIVTRVKLGKIPSDDPIAYYAGFMDAISGSGKGGSDKDLADAYKEGYRMGVSVKSGNEPKPDWFQV